MKRLLIPFGLILVIAAGVWKFGFSERPFSQRFPDGWTWEVNSIGYSGYPDAETGKYAEGTTLTDDPLNLTTRRVTAETDGLPAGQALISDHYETRDAITNAITWEFTKSATVDTVTGQYVEGEFKGDYYFLPRNVDKNTAYAVTNSSYISIPMTFQREETVAGINTYLFGNYEPVDSTVANAAFVTLEAGQEVWCFDFSLEYWVEPTTGEIVKYGEWCEGDWVINAATGERLYTISRWGGETTGDDLILSASKVSAQLNSYKWMTLYLPLVLLVAGVVLIGAGILPNFIKRNQKTESVVAAKAVAA